MVIDVLLAVLADHTFFFCGLLSCVNLLHAADNAIEFQAFSSCINLINIGVLQGGFFVFCKLEWGKADVIIAVRGHDSDWVVVVESLFQNQRNIDLVGVSKRPFKVCIMQVNICKCCRMVKTKLNFKKPRNDTNPISKNPVMPPLKYASLKGCGLKWDTTVLPKQSLQYPWLSECPWLSIS